MEIISDKEYEAIYKKYHSPILIYCNIKLQCNQLNAEDCTEKVFETLYSKKDQFYSMENIRAWLYRTADNFIRKSCRESKKDFEILHYEQFDDLEVNKELSETPDYDEQISEEQIEKYKDFVLSQLSPPNRELYQLKFVRKTSYSDLSIRYKTSENTLRQRVFCLRKQIIKLTLKCLK